MLNLCSPTKPYLHPLHHFESKFSSRDFIRELWSSQAQLVAVATVPFSLSAVLCSCPIPTALTPKSRGLGEQTFASDWLGSTLYSLYNAGCWLHVFTPVKTECDCLVPRLFLSDPSLSPFRPHAGVPGSPWSTAPFGKGLYTVPVPSRSG